MIDDPTKRKAPTGKSGPAPSGGGSIVDENVVAAQGGVKSVSAQFNPQISVCADAKSTATKTASLREVLQEIHDGEHRKQVEHIRKKVAALEAIADKDDLKDAKAEIDRCKKALPGILFSGEFSERNGGSLKQASGVLCVDIDAKGNEAVLKDAQTRSRIEDDPYTLAAFTSPSGTGLKVLVRIPTSCSHLAAFEAARDHFKTQFDLQVDDACSDISRICFTSYDPDLIARPDAPELPVQPAGGAVVQNLHSKAQGLSILDDFNSRGDPLPILIKHGWSVCAEKSDGSLELTRPGKDNGVSATWNHKGRRTLCVFSSNADPFKVSPSTYSASAIYAELECSGDFKRAAAELRALGFGPASALPVLTPLPASATDLRSRLQSCRFDAAKQPSKPSPRFFINGKGVCTAGNITTIAAQAKAGKSALIGAAIAAAICAENQTQGCDTLGLTATPPKGRRLLHFDTEQSPYDADRLVRRSLQRANAQAGVDFLDSYSVAGFSPRDLSESLRMLMSQFGSVDGIYAVILDGVADLVSDVNDAVECNAFIAELHALAIKHDCPIICILHENPAQDSGKMRGHLGSQLERKAESNLRLKRVESITTVLGDKMRGAPILEKDGPAFVWSAIEEMHVSTSTAAQTANAAKSAKYADLAEDVWSQMGNPTTARRCDVIREIMAARGIKSSAAEDRFDGMRALQVLIKDLKTGLWSLNPI
jgi:hypothetical protein